MEDLQQRGWISEVLIACSVIGLVAISIAVIQKDPPNTFSVFNSVLPLIGTWIGTILAYYFSRSNFATAATAYRQLATGGAVENLPVTSVMIDKGKIAGLVSIPANQTEAIINVQTGLMTKLSPTVTRIPILDSTGALKYILHENTLHKFIAENAINPQPGYNLTTASLQTLLASPPLAALAKNFVVVSSSASLIDAKKKMDEAPNCEDVFVTSSGQGADPMLGWITDATMAEHSRLAG